jgi:hypothetical protein
MGFGRQLDNSAVEYAYVFRHPKTPGYGIWVYSTIDKRDNLSRDCGTDAIRVMLYHEPTDTRFWSLPKVLRVESWRKNLRRRCRLAAALLTTFGDTICPNCSAPMRYVPNGKKKAFWGCVNYPSCRHVEWVEPMAEARERALEDARKKEKREKA